MFNKTITTFFLCSIALVTMQGCSSGGGTTDPIIELPVTTPPTTLEELLDQETVCIPFAATTVVTETTLPVDILWVIDTSASMCDLQQKVADGMDALTLAFTGLDLDVHMGCVTASMFTPGQSGELQAVAGEPKYVSGFDQASIDAFKANCPIYCNGHPYELYGTAMVTALEMSQTGLPNEGFLRDNASFTAIVITDEEDQSNSPIIAPPDNPYHYLYNSPQDIVDKLTKHKSGEINRVNYNLIAHIDPDPNGATLDACYDTTADMQAVSGIEAVNLLTAQKTNGKPGGSLIDICTTDDYSPVLPSLVNTALETEITEITFIDLSSLSFQPNPASILLTLSNGTVVTTGWTYNSAEKKIIFEDSTLQQSTGQICLAPAVGEV